MAWDWLRLYHGTVRDTKLALIAKKAKAHKTAVISAWVFLLEFASQNQNRGTIEGLDLEEMALDLDLEDDAVERIVDHMRERGLLDGDKISNWNKRQPKRERESDETNADRQRRFRERQKAAREAGGAEVTERNAEVTPSVTHNAALDTDTDTEREDSPSNEGVPSRVRSTALAGPTAQEISLAVDLYNATAEQSGLPRAQKLTEKRRRALAARLRDCGGLPGWEVALDKLAASPFLTGRTDRGFRADLDFLCQERSFTKLLEGSYDDRRPAPGAARLGSSPVMDAVRELYREAQDRELAA
jgi:hypothetical protein